MKELLRIYGPDEVNHDSGYPFAWTPGIFVGETGSRRRIPDYVRQLRDYRCERCGHPFVVGFSGPEWSRCDERCTHDGPWVTLAPDAVVSTLVPDDAEHAAKLIAEGWIVYGQWRVLTVHHLNGVKYDCRWWNLAALCQRCHLSIQGRVRMEQLYPHEHSEWFKPHAAAYYASVYLGQELTEAETLARLDDLLALERVV